MKKCTTYFKCSDKHAGPVGGDKVDPQIPENNILVCVHSEIILLLVAVTYEQRKKAGKYLFICSYLTSFWHTT